MSDLIDLLSKGIKPSFHNNQLLVSTGIDTLDIILGGGLPLGTVTIVLEDASTNYSAMILKTFSSQGIKSNQNVLFITANQPGEDFILSLPKPIDSKEISSKRILEENEKLDIAWRYENLKIDSFGCSKESNSLNPREFCSSYDFSQNINPSEIKRSLIETIDYNSFDVCGSYKKAYEEIERRINEKHKFGKSTKSVENLKVLKLVIDKIGSPYWDNSKQKKNFQNKDLCNFLIKLKNKVRESSTACVITIESNLYNNQELLQIKRFADCIFELKALKNSKELNFNGLVLIHKYFQINTILPSCIKNNNANTNGTLIDIGFRVTKKGFLVEKFHLPPEGGVSDRRIPESTNKSAGCYSTGKNIDF